MAVPAGGTFRYECVVHARRPGPFELSIRIFVDDNGVRPIDLTATGVAAE